MSLGVQGAQGTSGLDWQHTNPVGVLQDQFMKILLTQLKYQDPMEPVNQQDFLGQMAQFTTAVQIQDLGTNVAWLCGYLVESQLGRGLLEAAHLIGKEFEAESPRGVTSGVIEGVGFSLGGLVIHCEGKKIPIEHLVWIGGTDSAD